MNFNLNMGTADRLLRLVVAIIIGVLFYSGVITGALGNILVVLAVIFLVTCFLGTCPLYYPFGFSTRKQKQ